MPVEQEQSICVLEVEAGGGCFAAAAAAAAAAACLLIGGLGAPGVAALATRGCPGESPDGERRAQCISTVGGLTDCINTRHLASPINWP